MRRTLLVMLLVAAGCPTPQHRSNTDKPFFDNGEGEGADAGEGEGEGAAGEGEGAAIGEGEGAAIGEGEGAASGEGEGAASGEGEGEGEGDEESGPLSVLLIGNSQLGINPPDVGRALDDFSAAANNGANHLTVTRVQFFGEGCDQFVARGTAPGTPMGEASSGAYDVVILLPAIFETSADADCWDQFRTAATDAGSQFGIMATAHISSFYPDGFTALDGAVRSYAADHDVMFVPAGDSWLRVLGTSATGNTLFELYASDGQHPSPEGSYLYVLALYGAITHASLADAPNDVPALRCDLTQPCITFQELDDCIDDNDLYGCIAQNGAFFDGQDPQRAQILRPDEAAIYQAAVQASLDAR